MKSPIRAPWSVLLLTLSAAATVLPAQISRLEHRRYNWQEQRRRVLLEHCQAVGPEVLAKVAQALTEVGESVPPLTIARALAQAKGVEADAAFLFRAGLELYAMPEVLARPRFKEIPVTVHAPYRNLTGGLPMPKSWSFAVRITDAQGKQVFAGEIDKDTDMDALREYRSVLKVPCADWPQGQYGIEVRVVVDGEAPRAHDLPLRTSITIDDGFPGRADALQSDAFAAELEPLDLRRKAMLLATADLGRRAWHGIPGLRPGVAMQELEQAERMRRNLAAKRPLLQGFSGWVHTGLPGAAPAGDDAAPDLVFVSMRLPAAGLPARDSAAWKQLARRPLVLFFAAQPQLDLRGNRPTAPRSTLPRFLSSQLEMVGFDKAGRYQVCVVESPGRWAGMRRSVRGMLGHLAGVLPFDPERSLVIGDGFGAAAAVTAALHRVSKVQGLILANNPGGLATPQLTMLEGTRVLGLPGRGYYAAGNLSLLSRFAKLADAADRLKVGDPAQRPWCLVLPLASKEIEAFAARVFAD